MAGTHFAICNSVTIEYYNCIAKYQLQSVRIHSRATLLTTANESCSSSIARSTPTVFTCSGRFSVTGAKFITPSMPAATSASATALSGRSGHGDNRQTNVVFLGDAQAVVEVVDRHSFDALAHFGGVDVERRDDPKALLGKAPVTHQGPTQVSEADDGERPGLVGAQNPLDGRDELTGAVADARITELAEIGQVLADLGIGKSKQAA